MLTFPALGWPKGLKYGSQSVVSSAAATASRAVNLLKIKILESHQDLLTQTLWGWGPGLVLMSSLGDSDAHQHLRADLNERLLQIFFLCRLTSFLTYIFILSDQVLLLIMDLLIGNRAQARHEDAPSIAIVLPQQKNMTGCLALPQPLLFLSYSSVTAGMCSFEDPLNW